MAERAFSASTLDEVTCVYTYCGGRVDISPRIKKLIKSVIIEDDVTEIPTCLFEDCKALTSITFPKNGSFVKIGYRALRGCTSLATLAVPDSCVDIEEGALTNCSSLSSFTFPNKCTKLNDFVLAWCKSLTTLNISDGCIELEVYSMAGCSSLTTLAIPNACTQIGHRAFSRCTALKALANNADLTIEQYCRQNGAPQSS